MQAAIREWSRLRVSEAQKQAAPVKSVMSDGGFIQTWEIDQKYPFDLENVIVEISKFWGITTTNTLPSWFQAQKALQHAEWTPSFWCVEDNTWRLMAYIKYIGIYSLLQQTQTKLEKQLMETFLKKAKRSESFCANVALSTRVFRFSHTITVQSYKYISAALAIQSLLLTELYCSEPNAFRERVLCSTCRLWTCVSGSAASINQKERKTRLGILKGVGGKYTLDMRAVMMYCTSALEGSH